VQGHVPDQPLAHFQVTPFGGQSEHVAPKIVCHVFVLSKCWVGSQSLKQKLAHVQVPPNSGLVHGQVAVPQQVNDLGQVGGGTVAVLAKKLTRALNAGFFVPGRACTAVSWQPQQDPDIIVTKTGLMRAWLLPRQLVHTDNRLLQAAMYQPPDNVQVSMLCSRVQLQGSPRPGFTKLVKASNAGGQVTPFTGGCGGGVLALVAKQGAA